MNHVKALSIKFIATATVVFSTFGIFSGASLVNIFIITVLLTGSAYLIGDLFVLRFGNILATIADFGLAFVVVFLSGIVLFERTFGLFSVSLFSAVLIACVEAIFHIYMNKRVFNRDETIYVNYNQSLQTEFGEDQADIIELHKRKEKSERSE